MYNYQYNADINNNMNINDCICLLYLSSELNSQFKVFINSVETRGRAVVCVKQCHKKQK